jgi:integrase
VAVVAAKLGIDRETLRGPHGLPTISLHKLRHLAASLQLAAGVDIAIVSKRLRHSSIKITNDTYGHMIGTIGRRAAEAAAALVPLRHHAKKKTA